MRFDEALKTLFNGTPITRASADRNLSTGMRYLVYGGPRMDDPTGKDPQITLVTVDPDGTKSRMVWEPESRDIMADDWRALDDYIDRKPELSNGGNGVNGIYPTISRMLHYIEVRDAGDGLMTVANVPKAAIITDVIDCDHVNVAVFENEGDTAYPVKLRENVRLVRPGELLPNSSYCRWMQYQLGQAAKTDDVAARLEARIVSIETRLSVNEQDADPKGSMDDFDWPGFVDIVKAIDTRLCGLSKRIDANAEQVKTARDLIDIFIRDNMDWRKAFEAHIGKVVGRIDDQIGSHAERLERLFALTGSESDARMVRR